MFPTWKASGGGRDISWALEELEMCNRHRLGRREQPVHTHTHTGWREQGLLQSREKSSETTCGYVVVR